MPHLAVIAAFASGLVVSGILSMLIGFSGSSILSVSPAQQVVTSSSEAAAAFANVSVSQAVGDKGAADDAKQQELGESEADYAEPRTLPSVLTGSEAGTAEPGERAPLTDHEAALNRLVNSASGLHDASKKRGMLPGKYWLPERGGNQANFNKQLFEWLEAHWSVRSDKDYPRTDPLERAPKSHNCVVAINPGYRVIYIKLQKVAGTSVIHTMGGWCKFEDGRAVSKDWDKKGPCFWRMHYVTAESPEHFGFQTWEQMWKNYTIFTVVRNPYDRAASMYDYITGRRKERMETHPGCEAPTFKHFTARPYFLGVQDMLFHCTWHGVQALNFDFFHVEPQSDCLFTEEGKPVVDHVLRMGHLDEDYAALAKTLNEIRPKGSPPFKTEMEVINLGKLAQESGSKPSADDINKHLDKYLQCGDECFDNVRKYYEKDFELLQYPTSTQARILRLALPRM